MKFICYIKSGKAIIQEGNLRCAQPRSGDARRQCNKLLAKKNESNQIAGDFRCERCHQNVVVAMKVAVTLPVNVSVSSETVIVSKPNNKASGPQ